MSEPVGNARRSPMDIPGNSHSERTSPAPKEIDKDKAPAEAPEPATKIVEGKVVTRKQPWYRRMGRSLIADDAQSVSDFLLTDVVIPSVKNLIRDLVVGGVDRSLYGQGRSRPGVVGSRGEPRSLRTRYDQVASGDRGEPRRMMSREAQARHDFREVTLDDRQEAIEVVNAMIERVARFGAASVADLYDMLGVTGSFADQRWGWRNLDSADIRQHRNGWLLDFPAPEPLRG